MSPARAASMAALSARRLDWSAMSLMSARMEVISWTRLARASVRSLLARMSCWACSRLSRVSTACSATWSTVSAIWVEVRASSSMLADVSLAAELCCAVVAASSLEAADSPAADSASSTLVRCTRVTRPPRRSTMRLKLFARVSTSAVPAGGTRAERSPSAMRRAVAAIFPIGWVRRIDTSRRRTTSAAAPPISARVAVACWVPTGARATAAGSVATIAQPRGRSRA